MRHLIALAVMAIASGCATVNGPPNRQDPWESYNRGMYKFNDAVDKAVLKPEGMAAIDSQIIAKLKDVQKLELVLVTGHTDRIGSQAYNQKLSERRADAVRNYLVSKGVAKDKIETLGMGKTQPVPGVTCNQKNRKELIACLQPNRRVEVEVKGEAVKK